MSRLILLIFAVRLPLRLSCPVKYNEGLGPAELPFVFHRWPELIRSIHFFTNKRVFLNATEILKHKLIFIICV